jgi:hypothetical protein
MTDPDFVGKMLPIPASSGRHLSSLCLYLGGRGGPSTSNRRPLAVYELAYGPVVPPPLPPIEADIRQIAEVYRLANCPTGFGRGDSSIGSLYRLDQPICGESRFPCFSECWSHAKAEKREAAFSSRLLGKGCRHDDALNRARSSGRGTSRRKKRSAEYP